MVSPAAASQTNIWGVAVSISIIEHLFWRDKNDKEKKKQT